jgi:hypothetical protein
VEIQGIEFKGLQPEALFAIPGTNKVQMLSDDGGEMIGAQRCKEIDDEAQQAFRSTIVSLARPRAGAERGEPGMRTTPAARRAVCIRR